MPIVYSQGFYRDLERIYRFLILAYPKTKALAAKQIKQTISPIKRSPTIGFPNKEFREVISPFGKGSFVLRYRIRKNDLVLLHIWHDKENRFEE